MRILKYLSPRNPLGVKQVLSIPDEITNWGELSSFLVDTEINTAGLQHFVSVSEDNTQPYPLKYDDQSIPNSNFTIVAAVAKSEAGAYTRTELLRRISLIIQNDESARAHFTVGERNFTQITSFVLLELLQIWEEEEVDGNELEEGIQHVKSWGMI